MKQNKFLTGYLVVTLLGAGALGFLVFQAKGKYSEAQEAYTTKAASLTQLQSGKPYPDKANVARMEELQKAHQQEINKLQGELAKAKLPVKPLRPSEFQDKLKATLDRLRAAAQQQGVVLGSKETPKLDLDMAKYLTEPPKEEAAAPLGRMLDAIDRAVTELIKNAPAEIRDVKRVPLPEEGGGAQAANAADNKKGGKPGKDEKDKGKGHTEPLVTRYPFEIEFVAAEPKVRNFINTIVADKTQFYIPAGVQILSELQNGPSKGAPGASAPQTPPPAPNNPGGAAAPGGTATPAAPAEVTKFIMGEEKLGVKIRLEYVDFAEPPAEKTSEKSKKNAK